MYLLYPLVVVVLVVVVVVVVAPSFSSTWGWEPFTAGGWGSGVLSGDTVGSLNPSGGGGEAVGSSGASGSATTDEAEINE